MSSGACDWPSLTGHSRFDTCLLVRGHHKVRLAFTERFDSGYRFPIGIPIYRFRTDISVV